MRSIVEAQAAFVLIGIHNGWLNGPSKDSRGGSDRRCTRGVPCTCRETPLKSQKVCMFVQCSPDSPVDILVEHLFTCRSADLADPQGFGSLLKGRCSSQSPPAATCEQREEAPRNPVEYSCTWMCCWSYGGDVSTATINHPYFDGLCNPFAVVKLGMLYYCFTHIVTLLVVTRVKYL